MVLVSPNSVPPVAKIMDYGKYQFEQQKKLRENRKKQQVTEVKGMRLSPNIDIHDFNTKANNTRKFLLKGNKVRIFIRFKGRQMAHVDLGKDVMERFYETLSDVADLEEKPKLDGNQMTMVLAPKR